MIKKFKNKLMKQMMKKKKGFTLIEMVIVVAIVALLMLLVVPNVAGQKQKSEAKTDEAFIQTIQTQVELADEKPSSLESASKDLITESQQKRIKKMGLVLDKDGHVVKQ